MLWFDLALVACVMYNACLNVTTLVCLCVTFRIVSLNNIVERMHVAWIVVFLLTAATQAAGTRYVPAVSSRTYSYLTVHGRWWTGPTQTSARCLRAGRLW